MDKKHNGIIGLWKFLFAIMIVIFHGKIMATSNTSIILFLGGYIGVEFFFVVSGYFLGKAIAKRIDDDCSNLGMELGQFIWKKIVSFMPYVLLAQIFILGISYFVYNLNIRDIVTSFYDVFLIGMAGFGNIHLNPPIWYLSAMIISMMIIYPLMRKFKNNYVYLGLPLILLLGFGYLNHNFGTLDFTYRVWDKFFYVGLLRGFLELNLGVLIYFIVEKIKKISFTFLGRVCLTIIEIGCFLFPFLVTTFISNSSRYDYVMLLVIAIGIVIAFSEKTLDYKVLSTRLVSNLEKLSLPLFINHWIIYLIFDYLRKKVVMSYALGLSSYLFCCLIFSIFVYYFIEWLRRKGFYIRKILNLFINFKTK